MSQKNLINHELMISGSGDACNSTNPLCLPDKEINLEKKPRSKCASAHMNPTKLTPANEVLKKKVVKSTERVKKGREQISDLKRRSQLRRALTLNDMSPPQRRERLQNKANDLNKISTIDKTEFLGKQLAMSKLLSTLYYKLWKKKKNQSDELKEQIKKLLVQKSFLNQMREKESRKRDELSKITEHLYKTVAEYESQVLKLQEERDTLKLTLHNMSNSLTEIRLELEKSEYLKIKFQKINNEHLEHMHRINDELAKLKMENKEQKLKIVYMNNVADQQDYNLKQLHKIAEDLDIDLKENIEYARNVLRRRDEAIEQEEQATYKAKMLEACLKETKESEKKLRLDINQIKHVVDESEKRKLLITLENVDLKYKLESTEILLTNALAQMKHLEMQKELFKSKSIFCNFGQKFLDFVPWQNLFQFGIHFFPIFVSSLTTL